MDAQDLRDYCFLRLIYCFVGLLFAALLMSQLCVAQPTIDVLEKFNDTISSLFTRMLNCLTENKMLIKQRDELLPLLMNGQVSVNYHLSLLEVVVNIGKFSYFIDSLPVLLSAPSSSPSKDMAEAK